jgi:4-hydroxy-4-methyl-2-oxoglutarate aldolase
VPRPPLAQLDELAGFGVATVHEALGRVGYLGPELRPSSRARIAGSVVTALVWPGDNLMIHAAVEQCAPGDILVVAPTSPCTDGLLRRTARHLARRARSSRPDHRRGRARHRRTARDGLPGLVAARQRAGHGQGHRGSGQRPGRHRRPDDPAGRRDPRRRRRRGDAPARDLGRAIEASKAREAKEQATREALAAGELGLDRYNLRPLLKDLGVEYLSVRQYLDSERSHE